MTTIRAAHAPDDDAEGAYTVIYDGDGGYYVVTAVGSRIVAGPYPTQRIARVKARAYAREYDATCLVVPLDRMYVEQAAAREVRALRHQILG